MSLRDFLKKALEENWATGHFNASELDQIRAIVEACKEVSAPALIGTSEGERKHLGLKQAVALRDAFRQEFGIPIFLNADHSKSVTTAKEAVDAGYDSVHIDLSALPFEENVKGTKEIVDYVRSKFSIFKINPLSEFTDSAHRKQKYLPPTQLSVEGELGYLRGESKIQKEKIEVRPEDYTDPKEAANFVEKTGVDRLAIAVGNIHGISLDEPALDIERIKAVRDAVSVEVALVLHAGSGIPDEQIKRVIQAGIVNIHINTDLRIAFASELKKSFEENPEETTIYKLDAAAVRKLKELVKEKLKLFGSVNKI